jgi:DNA-directed RNA polymerase subunit K/omega
MEDKISKYEKVQIISARAKQISECAPSTIDTSDFEEAVEIATEEFNCRKIPILLVRSYPDGSIKELDVNKLDRF